MFEICINDIRDFTIKSIKLYQDPEIPLMAMVADFVLIHKHIPTIELLAYGGLQYNGCFYWTIAPKNLQDIISAEAQTEIRSMLVELMDDLMDFSFKVHLKMY